MTIKEMATEALRVQDASNLSGVVHCWSEVLTNLWEIARKDNHDTKWVNEHPISKLFAEKCYDLSKANLNSLEAFEECRKLASD